MAISKAQLAVSPKEPLASEQTYSGLRIFNGVMGLLHLAQGILMLILSNNFALPFTTAYLKFDPAARSLTQNLQEAGSLRIGPVVAAFLLLSAVAHFGLATFGYRWYVSNLQPGYRPARHGLLCSP